MSSPLVQFFLGEAPRQGLLALLAFAALSLAAAAAMGWNLRRRPLLGLGIGLIHLIGASDLAYYLCWGLHLPVRAFGPLTALVLGLVIVLVSRPVIGVRQDEPDDRPSVLLWPVVGLIVALVWLLFIMTPEPSEGFDEFQTWYPLYVEGSVRLGYFGTEETMALGRGLMASGGLYYQPNLLGLVALAGWSGWSHHLFPAYMAAAALCSMAGLAALAETLRRHGVALAAFAALVLVYALWSDGFRLLELYVGYDHVLPLVGALLAALLAEGGPRSGRRAALVAGFLVFGRNYGALMGASVYLALAGRDWRMGRFLLVDWVRLGGAYVVFNAKEVGQALLYGPYFPRVTLEGGGGWNLGDILVDILRHMGFLPHEALLKVPLLGAVPGAAFALLALIPALAARRRLLPLVWPALLLALPGVVELVTGYIRGAFSKPYYIIVALYPWWPAFILARAGVGEGWARPKRLLILTAVMAGALAPAVFWLLPRTSLGRMGPSAYVTHMLESYRTNNHSLMIGRRLADLGPDIATQVRTRPILYFYQEPGLGLRYYVGGDFFTDLDFYSERVQKVLERAPSLEAGLLELGVPSLYFSYEWKTYRSLWSNWTREPLPEQGWRKLEDAMGDLAGKPWVKTVVRYRYSSLVVLDEAALRAAVDKR